jgi:hypothetical protein
MCTVTFVPAGNAFHFTSSRDEHASRPNAVVPSVYEMNNHKLLYPRDSLAGGTWIVASEAGYVGVLLNGAIKPHHPQPPYRQSRGMILLDLISNPSPADSFEEMNFKGIEPFTIILFQDRQLYAAKWDGEMKWIESLNAHKPQIWSSVTLYDNEIIHKRESWFNRWRETVQYPGTLDIIHFHQHGGDGNPWNDILMNRDNQVFTNSISSIRLSTEALSFRYIDFRSGKSAESILPLEKSIAATA